MAAEVPGARWAVAAQLDLERSGALAAGIGGRRRSMIPACRDCTYRRQTAQALGIAKSGSAAAIVIPVIQEFYKTVPILIKVLQSR